MRDAPDVIARPPLLYVGALALGLALDWAWPAPFLPPAPQYVAAAVLIALGGALAGWAFARFIRAGTNLPTNRPAMALVTEGPYRYSRNPIYIALTLLYLGIALAVDSAWIAALVVPVLAAIRYGVVARRAAREHAARLPSCDEATMADLARVWRPAAWFFYVVLVFEILFMISPAALYFYSVYGPALNFLQQWRATTWLTQFFLPHISVTGNPLLDHLGAAGGILVVLGAVIFLAAALPLYAAKLRRRGAVTGGLYRYVRHPQYLGLAVMGLGTTLIWPRFLVLVAFVAMLFLYVLLARWEEAQCIARFGDPYRAYLARTGRFLPRLLPLRRSSLLPAARAVRAAAMLVLFAAALAATVAGAMALRGYSLGQVAGLYRDDLAVISPARLSRDELEEAYRLAAADPRVKERLAAAAARRLLVHVVPEAANLPDLPIDAQPARGGHHVPRRVDRTRLKVLFSRPRSHAAAPEGRDIVRTAHGLDPIVVVRLDLAKKAVTGVMPPPAHVRWGDIPTPLF